MTKAVWFGYVAGLLAAYVGRAFFDGSPILAAVLLVPGVIFLTAALNIADASVEGGE